MAVSFFSDLSVTSDSRVISLSCGSVGVGDIIVVAKQTWDGGITYGVTTETGTATVDAFTNRVTGTTSAHTTVYLDTATVTGAGTLVISSTPAGGNSIHTCGVWVFPAGEGYSLAGSPKTFGQSVGGAGGATSGALSGFTVGSFVCCTYGDWNGVVTARTYGGTLVSTPVEDGAAASSTNSVQVYFHAVPTATSGTILLSTPNSGVIWSIAGVEILKSSDTIVTVTKADISIVGQPVSSIDTLASSSSLTLLAVPTDTNPNDVRLGPVGSPPIQPIGWLLDDAYQPRRDKRPVISRSTSIVLAIPLPDDWFEAPEIPAGLKTKRRLPEDQAVFAPAAAAAPEVVYPPWVDQSESVRLRRKTFDEGTAAPPAPRVTIFASQWSEQIEAPRRTRKLGQFDQTSNAPVYPPPLPIAITHWDVQGLPTRRNPNLKSFEQVIGPVYPPPLPIAVTHWLGQSEPTRVRAIKADAASATIDAIIVNTPIVVTHWLENPRPAKRNPNLLPFEQAAAPLFPPAPATEIFVSHWLEIPRATKRNPNLAPFDQAASPLFPPATATPIVLPQWDEQPLSTKVRPNPRPFDQAVAPIFPPPPATDILLPQWDAQPQSTKRNPNPRPFAEGAPIFAPPVVTEIVLSQWLETSPATRRKPNLPQFDQQAAPGFPQIASGVFVSHWSDTPPPPKARANLPQFEQASATFFPPPPATPIVLTHWHVEPHHSRSRPNPLQFEQAVAPIFPAEVVVEPEHPTTVDWLVRARRRGRR